MKHKSIGDAAPWARVPWPRCLTASGELGTHTVFRRLARAVQVKEFVGILRHLDYGVYVAHSHNAAFEDLVNDVAGLFERSQDVDTLAATAATLAHCARLPQLRLCEAAAQTASALQAKAVDKLDECAEQLSSVADAAMKVPCRLTSSRCG